MLLGGLARSRIFRHFWRKLVVSYLTPSPNREIDKGKGFRVLANAATTGDNAGDAVIGVAHDGFAARNGVNNPFFDCML